jgi:hypothetical protein
MAGRAHLCRGALASWPAGDRTGQGGERREKMIGLMCSKQKQRGPG